MLFTATERGHQHSIAHAQNKFTDLHLHCLFGNRRASLGHPARTLYGCCEYFLDSGALALLFTAALTLAHQHTHAGAQIGL